MKLRSLSIVVLLVLMTACTRIGPGHVGIKINMAGSNRGVEDLPIVTGWVTYNIFSQKVIEYPTFMQTAVWTSNTGEGKAANEEFSFNTSEGAPMTADVSISYQLQPEKVPHFYVKFKTDDLETFTHGFLHNVVRDALSEVSSAYTVEEVYGPKKSEVIAKVRKFAQDQLAVIGVNIQQLGFVTAPRPPQNVVAALNAKVQQTQNAIQAQNKVVQAKAEADQQIEKARGEAESQYLRAKREADGNKLLSESVTEGLIRIRSLQVQEQAIAKWNGARPYIEGGGNGQNFLFQVPVPR